MTTSKSEHSERMRINSHSYGLNQYFRAKPFQNKTEFSCLNLLRIKQNFMPQIQPLSRKDRMDLQTLGRYQSCMAIIFNWGCSFAKVF